MGPVGVEEDHGTFGQEGLRETHLAKSQTGEGGEPELAAAVVFQDEPDRAIAERAGGVVEEDRAGFVGLSAGGRLGRLCRRGVHGLASRWACRPAGEPPMRGGERMGGKL